MKISNKIITTASLLVGLSGFASSYPQLDAAHEAYLKGDVAQMALRIRDTLIQDPPESVKRNALALLKASYGHFSGSQLVSDWRLPAEIRKLKITQRRTENGGPTTYKLKVAGNTAQLGVVKQLQLVKFPHQVVLDKKAQVGDWTEQAEPIASEGIYFQQETEAQEVPATEGLYFINMELNTGASVNGWVILSDLVSDRAPQVMSPVPNEVFSTGHPTFRFENFYSAHFQPGERRVLGINVARMEPPDYKWDLRWELYTADLPKTKVTVGYEPDGIGAKSLAPGRYRAYITYKEERNFGEVRLGRQSATAVPFQVQ